MFLLFQPPVIQIRDSNFLISLVPIREQSLQLFILFHLFFEFDFAYFLMHSLVLQISQPITLSCIHVHFPPLFNTLNCIPTLISSYYLSKQIHLQARYSKQPLHYHFQMTSSFIKSIFQHYEVLALLFYHEISENCQTSHLNNSYLVNSLGYPQTIHSST